MGWYLAGLAAERAGVTVKADLDYARFLAQR